MAILLPSDHFVRNIFRPIINHLSALGQNLIHTLKPNLHHPDQGKPTLTLNMLDMPLPPLRLLNNPHRLTITAHNPHTALKQPLVDIRRPLERELARTQRTHAIEPQNIAGLHIGHPERQPHLVASGHEVRLCVQVGGYEVLSLRIEVGQLFDQGLGYPKRAREDRGEGLFRSDEVCERVCWRVGLCAGGGV